MMPSFKLIREEMFFNPLTMNVIFTTYSLTLKLLEAEYQGFPLMARYLTAVWAFTGSSLGKALGYLKSRQRTDVL